LIHDFLGAFTSQDMSSPKPIAPQGIEDDPMDGSIHEEEDEGEGDAVAPMEDDSSEEEEDNPEDLRKVAQGFIVDEDEEVEEDREVKRRRKKHHKHKRPRSPSTIFQIAQNMFWLTTYVC
jgi:hypothetical protein